MDIKHMGVPGQEWYKNKADRYQKHARYAMGRAKPAASGKKNECRNKVDTLFKQMQQDITYSEYTSLQSPEQTAKKKSGSCHDQVMYELDALKKAGVDAKARFVIEYDDNGQGGTTHSYVYVNNGDHVLWLENAWGGKEGVHSFKSVDAIERYIFRSQMKGEFGDPKKFPNLEFADFIPEHHKPGEGLGDLVNICLNEE